MYVYRTVGKRLIVLIDKHAFTSDQPAIRRGTAVCPDIGQCKAIETDGNRRLTANQPRACAQRSAGQQQNH